MGEDTRLKFPRKENSEKVPRRRREMSYEVFLLGTKDIKVIAQIKIVNSESGAVESLE